MRMLLMKKLFGISFKLLFSEKGSTHDKLTLVKQDFKDKNDNVAEVLNNFPY